MRHSEQGSAISPQLFGEESAEVCLVVSEKGNVTGEGGDVFAYGVRARRA